MLVIEHLRRGAIRHPNRLAFVSDDVHLNYADMLAEVERIAGGMLRLGCAPGTPVAILCPNDPRAFACMLGVLHAGAAWVPVNIRNGAEANAEFLARIGCRWLFWHGSLADDVSQIRARVPSLSHCIQIDGTKDDRDTLGGFADGAGEASTALIKSDSTYDPNRVCTILGTGGTTGAPKAVCWTEATWNALLANTAVAMPCEGPPVHLCVAPMTHAAGVLVMMLMPAGPTNVMLDRADPLEIMRAIEQQQITHLYLPPTLLYLMLAHPDVRSFDYTSLRYFLITAAPIAPERLKDAISIFGPVMAQCYGQSEAPMIMTFFPPTELAAAAAENDARKLQSCGRATILTRLAVMDEVGRLLPAGEVGEIVARSPLVMHSYLDDPDASAAIRRHGWHHTGDIGIIDADGYVSIVDRAKDMIITGGFNVYPVEIERVILSHPSVQECAVIGVPDDKWGEAVTAIVELKYGEQADADAIIRLCRERLGGIKAPKAVEFRDTLPRSAVGKVLKRALRDPYWAGRSRAV